MHASPVMLGPRWRLACTILNIAPLPGVGAIIAGWRNPHTSLMRNGIAQALLVIFGSWPWLVPGAIGFGWAIWTATRLYAATPGVRSAAEVHDA